MKEFIEKLLGRLEEINHTDYGSIGSYESHVAVRDCLRDVKGIVKELAEEYNNESVKGDLISRSALIEAINEQVKGWGKKGIMPSLFSAVAIVQNQPTVCNDDWIPVSERLPESGVPVIVSYKDRFLSQADGTCEGWYDATNMIWHLTDYEYSDNVEVIAWRERLTPYQPKGE